VNAHYVRRNLLASHGVGAGLRHYTNFASLSLGLLRKMLEGRIRYGKFPFYVPPGGSCPLGVAGYVNAALELRDQVKSHLIPEPDRIYVPLGSMGTAVGLALGLKAAGLKTQVAAVRVIEDKWSSARALAALFAKSAALLRRLDPTFPRVTLPESNLVIDNGRLGPGYAHFTEKGVEAARLMRARAGIVMNGAYSAKAFSAILADAERPSLKGQVVLFWNTYNSRDLSIFTSDIDYRELPESFHHYFEDTIQPLDKDGLDR
jgi:D-cysteine desulfhydrase